MLFFLLRIYLLSSFFNVILISLLKVSVDNFIIDIIIKLSLTVFHVFFIRFLKQSITMRFLLKTWGNGRFFRKLLSVLYWERVFWVFEQWSWKQSFASQIVRGFFIFSKCVLNQSCGSYYYSDIGWVQMLHSCNFYLHVFTCRTSVVFIIMVYSSICQYTVYTTDIVIYFFSVTMILFK